MRILNSLETAEQEQLDSELVKLLLSLVELVLTHLPLDKHSLFLWTLTNFSAAAVDVSADSIAIVDANDSNASKKESIADLMTAVAGNGLAASSGVLAVGVDDTGIEINS